MQRREVGAHVSVPVKASLEPPMRGFGVWCAPEHLFSSQSAPLFNRSAPKASSFVCLPRSSP